MALLTHLHRTPVSPRNSTLVKVRDLPITWIHHQTIFISLKHHQTIKSSNHFESFTFVSRFVSFIVTMNTVPATVPTEYVCPLSKKVMTDPLLCRYGHHFERSAIMKWLNNGNTYCPVTGNPLRPSMLISDKTLQWKIQYWATKHGYDLCQEEHKVSEEEMDPSLGAPFGFIAIPHKHFLCALTDEIMEDPVVTKEGINFDRKSILRWLDEQGDFCPITKKPLTPAGLIPNSSLKFEIDQWQLTTGDPSQLMSALELEGKLSKAMMISRQLPLSEIVMALAAEHGDESSTSKPVGTPKMAKEDMLSALDDLVDMI